MKRAAIKVVDAIYRNQRRAFCYERVSTATQAHDMQRTRNAEYAAANALPIIRTATDTASGAIPWNNRAIADAITHHNQYTDVIVYELSRVGRDLADTLTFLRDASLAGITVHISRTSMTIGDGIDGKIMATVLGLAADIEREFVITRTRDALAERQTQIDQNGGFLSKAGIWRASLGRPAGTGGGSKLAKHAEQITTLIEAKVSDSAIARLLSCSRATVARFRATLPPAELAGTTATKAKHE